MLDKRGPVRGGAAGSRGEGTATDSAARAAVLQVALDLFSNKGYAGTSVREIVSGAGVTPPTLYYHFGSKVGLFRLLADDCTARLHDALTRAAASGSTTAERLASVANAHFDAAREQATTVRLVWDLAVGPHGHLTPAERAATCDRLISPVRSILEPNGATKNHDAEELAISFTGLVGAWVRRFLGGHGEAPGARRAEQLVDLFTFGTAGGTARVRKP